MFEWLFGGSSSVGDRIAAAALQEVGVSERNNISRVMEYLAPTGFRSRVAWCQAFGQYIANKVQPGIVAATASVSNMMDYFRGKGALSTDADKAEKGDSVFFKGHGESHTATVVATGVNANGEKTVTTVGGNEGKSVQKTVYTVAELREAGARFGNINIVAQRNGISPVVQEVAMADIGGFPSFSRENNYATATLVQRDIPDYGR